MNGRLPEGSIADLEARSESVGKDSDGQTTPFQLGLCSVDGHRSIEPDLPDSS
jgi:hypothetical protein